jgi:hypothetical protein
MVQIDATWTLRVSGIGHTLPYGASHAKPFDPNPSVDLDSGAHLMPFNVGPAELVVMLVMMLAFAVVFGLVIRALASTGRRACPVCGSHVKPGLTTCARCQHDFSAAQQS